MERRFAARRDQLLANADVDSRILRDLLPRLERFLDPFVASLPRSEPRQHARCYVAGLLSHLEYKNVESIAYLHDQPREPLQQFIGQSPWEHDLWFTELATQVGQRLGSADGVLVFDPSAFPKKGKASVGVQRQWCGRLGKIDNCQVGIYLAYVGRGEHALVDVRLYLPKEWARDRRRRQEAGVPRTVRFRTRHELALEMLDARGPLLPHAWISGDDEMGRCSRFRQELRARGERYLLAVPSNTTVRDLTAADPPYAGRGARPRVPFTRVEAWCRTVPESAWQTIEVRPGEKGPIRVQGVWTLVQARTEGRVADVPELLVVFREVQADGSIKHDYLLSNADLGTPLAEFARVFKAQHRVEECLQRSKGEAGLADYEVRTWRGWYHHQALALTATWFLTVETQRGKKMDAGTPRTLDDLRPQLVFDPLPGRPESLYAWRTTSVGPTNEPLHLLVEQDPAQQLRFAISNLPARTDRSQAVEIWDSIQEASHGCGVLREQLGLDHFEGRSWRGFHHHACLVILAYGFRIWEKTHRPEH